MIGENIKKLRQKRRITQEELAKLMGVSRQAVCMWETDKRELKVTTLNRLAKVFNVGVKELIGEESGSTKGSRYVKFEFFAPPANTVLLAGDFNNWGAEKITLIRDRKGLWSTKLSLKPGRYQYKFIVDGKWVTDPVNSTSIRNQFGTENSLKEV